MNDLSNSLPPPSGDDALEARIVAWVLGEASPFEAAELEKLCAENPHLREFERRTRDLHELLVDDAKPGLHAAWQLPPGKREKITDLLGVAPRLASASAGSAQVNRYFSRRILLAAAACLAISFVSFPLFNSRMEKGVMASAPEKSVDFIAASDGGGERVSARREQASDLDALRRAVRDQEDVVEDKRKELTGMIRSAISFTMPVRNPGDRGSVRRTSPRMLREGMPR